MMQVWASFPKACWSPAASGREAVPLAALRWPDSWAGTWAAAQPPVPSLGTRVPGWQREGFGWTRHSLPPTRGCRLPPRSDCGASAETGLLESALREMCAGELHFVCQALEVPGAELCVSDISWCMECVLLRGVVDWDRGFPCKRHMSQSPPAPGRSGLPSLRVGTWRCPWHPARLPCRVFEAEYGP